MKNATMPIAAVLALGAALAMPVALAQSAITPEVRAAEDAAVESAATARQAQDGTPQTQDAAQTQAPTTDGQPAGRQLGWNDVDADGNGTISREESAALSALAAVFDGADADGDGELTADEYRSHAAKAGGQD
ncbi:EF-hand domain-containing protein [Luteimonas sp. MC1895]|uniref:EF-hand domain-containing protein n=1 Tax=Luteimonas sp. MC1895 TaxID=2819513 RepID=UPI0018F0A00B|nr:EF-hand domain-containing protein [Luteimonas sp. MC1895]MBJ6978898.1 EF-hand domain-containing protein [Luteimonas sp. MC1895]